MLESLEIWYLFEYFFPTDESVLLDLKHLLIEAKQKIPPVLAALQAGEDQLIDIGGVEKVSVESLSKEDGI